jgi:excisionase family DNA binding protein
MSTTEVKVPRLLTIKQVAEKTGLQRFRVYQLVHEKRLPVIRIGSTFRVAEDVLAKWIAKESQAGGGTTSRLDERGGA